MRRNLAFWKTKLANAEKEVAALQGVVGPSEMTVLPSMSFSICFSRTPSLVKKRWLTWLRCRRIQRKARARLAMLLTTKLPYYKEQIARRTTRTAFDAIQTRLY